MEFKDLTPQEYLDMFPQIKLLKWAEKTKTELIKLIEEVFTKVSMPLNVVASFSNGGTIYQKA